MRRHARWPAVEGRRGAARSCRASEQRAVSTWPTGTRTRSRSSIHGRKDRRRDRGRRVALRPRRDARRQVAAERRPGQRYSIDHRHGDGMPDRRPSPSASALSASPSIAPARPLTRRMSPAMTSASSTSLRQSGRDGAGRTPTLRRGPRRPARLRHQPVRQHRQRHRHRHPQGGADHRRRRSPRGDPGRPSGANVYVACWFDNVLMRIDTAKLAVSGQAAVGEGPRAWPVFALSYRPPPDCSCSAASAPP